MSTVTPFGIYAPANSSVTGNTLSSADLAAAKAFINADPNLSAEAKKAQCDALDKGAYQYIEIKKASNGDITGCRLVLDLPLETMLAKGKAAVEAQDQALADLYDQMTKQTAALTEINDAMQAVRSAKTETESATGTYIVTNRDIEEMKTMLKDLLIDNKELTLGKVPTDPPDLPTTTNSEDWAKFKADLIAWSSSVSPVATSVKNSVNEMVSKLDKMQKPLSGITIPKEFIDSVKSRVGTAADKANYQAYSGYVIDNRTPPAVPEGDTLEEWQQYAKDYQSWADQAKDDATSLEISWDGNAWEKVVNALDAVTNKLSELNNISTSESDGSKSYSLPDKTIKTLKKLIDEGKLTVSDELKAKITATPPGALTYQELDTLQMNLSSAQSSQGALNEDLSLKLNEAANVRSAIFTQLQAMLQTIMQTRAQLARF
jgi:hypothetical protein